MVKKFVEGVTLVNDGDKQTARPMKWKDEKSGTQLERSGGSPEVYRFLNKGDSIVGKWMDTEAEAIEDGQMPRPVNIPFVLDDAGA